MCVCVLSRVRPPWHTSGWACTHTHIVRTHNADRIGNQYRKHPRHPPVPWKFSYKFRIKHEPFGSRFSGAPQWEQCARGSSHLSKVLAFLPGDARIARVRVMINHRFGTVRGAKRIPYRMRVHNFIAILWVVASSFKHFDWNRAKRYRVCYSI